MARSSVMNAGDVRRIAVLRALFLGDLICALPGWAALRERFPQAEITLIGLPWAADFSWRSGVIDRFVPFPGYPGIQEVPYEPERTARFLHTVRAAPFDLAIQMHGDGTVSNGFVVDLHAPLSLGYARGDDPRLTHTLPYDSDEHEAARWLRLVRMGLPGSDGAPVLDRSAGWSYPRLTTAASEQAHAAELLASHAGSGPLVGLHVGAKDAARRWPAERFAALGDTLARDYGARIVLTGSDGERALTRAVKGRMQARALDLAGATDLGTFIAVIERLALLVTNDTGASHVAAGCGTPSVVLFGPSNPAQWAPPNRERHYIIDARALNPGANPAAALAALPVEAVHAAAVAMLARQ
jgi:ADP-heptose:LPS heptosyltransferase